MTTRASSPPLPPLPPPLPPVDVYGILNKHSPYIGYFYVSKQSILSIYITEYCSCFISLLINMYLLSQYSAISKNIASFFANDVTTMEEVELR